MSNPWFRMYAEFATDPKVQMMSEVNQRRLTMLLCFRCNSDVTLHDDEVTFLLRVTNEEWQVTKALFIEKGFIDKDNNLLNWDKRQFTSDSSKNRVAAYRERKKQHGNNDVTLHVTKSNAIDTEQIQNRTDTEHSKSIGEKASPVAKQKKSVESKFDFRGELLKAGVSEKNADEWLKVRKAKKQVNTDIAFERLMSEVEMSGISVNEAVNYACGMSWGGFKAQWYENARASPAKQTSGLHDGFAKRDYTAGINPDGSF